MKGEVSRARAGRAAAEAVGRERGLVDVERVHEHLVGSQVAGHCEPTVSRGVDRMTVRLLLPLRIGALALVLDETAGRARHDRLEAAVGGEPEADHAAAAVVGSQRDFARAVDRHMARAAAAGRLMILVCECAGGLVDREREHRAGRLAIRIGHLRDGVQDRKRRMGREERRVLDGRCQHRDGQLSRGGIESRHIDSLAVGGATCVGAEPDELIGGRLGSGRGGRRARECGSQHRDQECDRECDGGQQARGNGRHRRKPSCCRRPYPRNRRHSAPPPTHKSYSHDRPTQRAAPTAGGGCRRDGP